MPPPGDWDAESDDIEPPTVARAVEQDTATLENSDTSDAAAQNISLEVEPILDWTAADAPRPASDAAESADARDAAESSAPALPLVLQSQVIPENKSAPPSPPTLPALPEIKLRGGVAIPSKNSGASRVAPNASNASANAARENSSAYVPRGVSNLQVRVRFQRSDDQQLDTKRMREVVKLLRSADGRDRFVLIVPLQKSWVELDFPNYYTNFQTVQQQLLEMVDDWGQVELG